jgi:hypothetical protein
MVIKMDWVRSDRQIQDHSLGGRKQSMASAGCGGCKTFLSGLKLHCVPGDIIGFVPRQVSPRDSMVKDSSGRQFVFIW